MPRKTGEIQDHPGVTLIFCGLNYAAFNAALLSQPVAGSAELPASSSSPPSSSICETCAGPIGFATTLWIQPCAAKSRASFNATACVP